MTRHAASFREKETRIPFREAGSTPGRIQNRYGVFKSECHGILLKERGTDASRLGGKLRDVVARNAVVAHLQVGYAAGDLKVMEGAQEVIRMNGILDAECMSERIELAPVLIM